MSTRSFSFSNDNPLSTEAVLVNASSSRYEEDWPSISHTHAFTELFYVSRGSGEFLIENQRFSIARDDLVIINPHILHTETSQSAAPLSYYTVGVDGISFSFRDQKEFQIFNCRKINTDLLFYFHSLFQELDEKKRVMKRFADTRFPFLLPSFAGLQIPASSWCLLFIQVKSVHRSSAIWIPTIGRISIWISWLH